MTKKISLICILIITAFLLCGCQGSGQIGQESDASADPTSQPASSSSLITAVLLCGCQSSGQIGQEADASAGPTSQPASSSSQKNKDMTGLPELVDTISSDTGDRLVLVNKLHGVSADYYPTDMVPVDGSLSTNQGLYFKREAYDAYLRMLSDANAEGLSFLICSTYRSYDLQKTLYNNSLAKNGAAYTYTYSAYPGRSEHHTGWAVDITSASMGYGLSQSFINYPEGLWINNHCSEYGFIIRYPKGKTHITGYAYEPWHLRYVGVDVAKEITARGITFEEYLGEA